VRAIFTTRSGGGSTAPFASLNLGVHVGDDAAHVKENRRRVQTLLPAAPVWLNQVHGINVVTADAAIPATLGADAAVTVVAQVPCAVLVADCLPVLFCTNDASSVGAAHAGWRGLHAGVLERIVQSMGVSPEKIMAWLGPAIGPGAFEVGGDVFEAFTSASPDDAVAFREIAGKYGKYFADIYALARLRLQRAGVGQIFGGQYCTVTEPARFFSYRRDGKTGRMAGIIWLE
jgi:YfiH family protein